MADNFEHMSIAIDIRDKTERAWWRTVRDLLLTELEAIEGDPKKAALYAELQIPEEARDCTICDIIITQGEVCLTDEGGTVQSDGLAAILQAFLRKFRPQGYIKVPVAYTCSKPRPGEFGGYAMLVTADRVLYHTLHAWLEEAVKSEGLYSGNEVTR